MNGKRLLSIILAAVLLCFQINLISCDTDGDEEDSGTASDYTFDIEDESEEQTREPGTFSLSFYADGELYSVSYYLPGDAVTAPDDPQVDGYGFYGWDTEIPAVMPEEDTVITAVLKPNIYTLTFMLDDNEYGTAEYEFGSVISADEPEYDSGTQLFGGWAGLPESMPAGDVTVYGHIYTRSQDNTVNLSELAAGTVYEINDGGEYIVTGTAADAQLLFDCGSEDVTLIMSDASVSYTGGAAVKCKNASSFSVITTGASSITSAGNTDDAALFVKTKLALSGAGTLKISSDTAGIRATELMTVGGGIYEINSADAGISGKAGLIISGGDILINSGTDGININESLDISAGTLDITSGTDGIQADGKININGNAEINIVACSGSNNNTKYSSDDTETSRKGIKSTGEIVISGGELVIDSYEAAIKSELAVTISGGTVNAASARDAIKAESEDGTAGDILISGGKLTVESKKRDGVSAAGKLDITGGTLSVKTSGTITHTITGDWWGGAFSGNSDDDESSKGLKSGLKMTITGGNITLDTTDHALHCADECSITGGKLTISSSAGKGIATHGNLNVGGSAVIVINKSTEAVESKKSVNIEGGSLRILASSDDGINTGGNGSQSEAASHRITISGGYVYIATKGDGLDSNGDIVFDGGVTVIAGPSVNQNAAIDGEYGTTYNAGTVVAIALSGSMWSDIGGDHLTGDYIANTSLGNVSAGDMISLVDGDGRLYASVTVTEENSYGAVIMCDRVDDIKECSIVVGGTLTGATANKDGYADSGTLTGGTSYSDSGISGGGFGGGGFGGGGGGRPGRP